MRVLLVAEQLRARVPGGIGTYVRALARDVPDVTLWVSRGPAPLASFDAQRLITSPLPGRALVWAWDRGRAAPPAGFPIVHAPSLAVPPPGDATLTVTVHDLAWRRVPETFPRRGRRWHEAALGRALQRATAFVVPSNHTADYLGAAGAPAARVEVVEEGCDHLPAPDRPAAAALRARLGVGDDYLLTVSTVEPRKNLARLVAAYEAARPRLPGGPQLGVRATQARVPLVVVGPTGWGKALEPQPGVVLAGPVEGATLAGLYAGARLMVSVPLVEGFGLPAVEAMAAGVPVVASPQPSTGGAAYQVEPHDVEAIATALVRVATDETLRADLVAAGRARAAALTWASCAARHIEFWESVGALQVRGR